MAEGNSLKERFEAGQREIGVLLITFAPLDMAWKTPSNYRGLRIFFGAGLFLFCAALATEARRNKTTGRSLSLALFLAVIGLLLFASGYITIGLIES